ncbi:aldehyde dehydrogenase family protein [Rhodoferax sp. GW822-FHT02A01]|uniref:aldehyde dehydrogenase family protein n=1 Tax=Rhodoferax sp. GW822-FHT02A01 TaxID=3141537 RepID=UPI00315CA7DA
MTHCNFYIDGQWVEPQEPGTPHPIINPATEESVGTVSMGGKADADRAVMAARRAFDAYSQTTLQYRTEMLQKLQAVFERRYTEMAQAISTEMGAPWSLAYDSQAECGPGHIKATLEAAKDFPFEVKSGQGDLSLEPIGVCVLITPWNWPMNQVVAKLAPALLAGCTVVLKPSEFAPLSAKLVAEYVHEVGYPAGVFNMVYGDGPVVGAALSAHPEVDMVSFTGSTGAGVAVAKAAADTVKRVVQELGGKSPNIIFADSDVDASVARGVKRCFNNTGQSCNAPTRMLVEKSVYQQAVAAAVKAGAQVQVIQPTEKGSGVGPLAMKRQFETVNRFIDIGMHCGARLVLGGPGRPEGFDKGYFVKPTIFADVTNDMPIARQEIFGPVLCMIPFEDEEDAIRIANDTPYGLAAYLSTNDKARARRVAKRLRAGNVSVNASGNEYCNPFGGYKQSGNGREWGRFGLHEFMEYKIVNGL